MNNEEEEVETLRKEKEHTGTPIEKRIQMKQKNVQEKDTRKEIEKCTGERYQK